MEPEDSDAADQEFRDLVWASATELSAREYSVLDMHVRHDISANDIAANIGVKEDRAHAMLGEMTAFLNETVGSVHLIRRGRENCPDLDALLSQADTSDDASTDLRQAVQQHLKACAHCRAALAAFLLRRVHPSFTPVTPPAGLKEIAGNRLPPPLRLRRCRASPGGWASPEPLRGRYGASASPARQPSGDGGARVKPWVWLCRRRYRCCWG
jgi:hypothetical protein